MIRTLKFIPTIGICIFFILFLYATSLYPGGSRFNKEAKGYSWEKNYWCELVMSEAVNGEKNPAKPYGIIAITFWAIGLSYFFFKLPFYCKAGYYAAKLVQISGIAAPIMAIFLFTEDHDLILIVFTILTLITLTSTLVILIRNGHKYMFTSGILALLLVQTNNISYYLRLHKDLLPAAQKITMSLVSIWIIAVNINFALKKASSQNKETS